MKHKNELIILLKEIHKAIHDADSNFIQLGNQQFTIHTTTVQGLKQLTVQIGNEEIRFIEQSLTTNSYYSQLAKAGRKITWGIRKSGKWIYIDDYSIKIPHDFKIV